MAEGGGRLLFDMWQKKEKKLPLLHHILQRVTFQYGNGAVTLLPAQHDKAGVLLSVLNLHSPLTCRVEQENVAACTLCKFVIRGRFTSLFENEVSK